MPLHVIVGAGPVGSATAALLVDQGEQVRMVTRSGGGPEHPGIERVAADASDADRLTGLTRSAVALYNCVNPLYHRWLTDWPPIAASLRTAAERSGAVLTTAGNLYGYGPVSGPITASTPLAATHPKLRVRAQMWRDDLAAHDAGRLRTTEVRSSDYIESNSILTMVLAKPLLAGKRAYVPASLDVLHSWTAIRDVARTLVTVAADERAWGSSWLTPTDTALTVRDLAQRFADAAGAPTPKLSSLPYPVLWTAGLFDPFVRELRATRYQFVRPFVVDSRLTTTTFGLEPTPLAESLRTAVPVARAIDPYRAAAPRTHQ